MTFFKLLWQKKVTKYHKGIWFLKKVKKEVSCLTFTVSRVSILRGCEMEFEAGPPALDPATGPSGGPWDGSNLGLLWACTPAAAIAAAALAAFMAAAAELFANEVA